MIDVSKLNDEQLVRLIDNRWKEAAPLWLEIKKAYEENKKRWQNNPDWLKSVPKKKSKARDNRIFLDTESVITNLTGRPSKPNVIPGNETDEAQTIADNLQDYFLERYRQIQLKKKMRKGLRFLFFSRLIVFKIFWDPVKDDYDQKPVHPLSVRFTPVNATDISEVEVFMEEIKIPISKMIERFPDKEEKILKMTGFPNMETLQITNPKETYYEVWLGNWVVYKFRNSILKKEPNPYWDWEGVKMLEREMRETERKPGAGKRVMMAKIKTKGWQDWRRKAEAKGAIGYETVFYNHFRTPRPPYLFGSVFEEEDKPIGETSLIEQASSLQEEIDKRKRQFSDNAEMMNGVWKIDTEIATGFSKADAQRAKANPSGIIYGKGVKEGVVRETGKELPSFLQNDLIHSISEVDNIFGTQPTFRGELAGSETATGRAIAREQSYQRLNELIDLVDSLHEQSYNWWLQMMKVRYTEEHLGNVIGRNKAVETMGFMQDDFDEGMEVRVVPGQIMPEDRFYRAERATEAVQAGILDPLSYFEITDWDNPMEQAKRLIMFQANPFSIIDLDDEDIQKLQQAQQMFGEGAEGDRANAEKASAIRQQVEQMVNSPEFQRMSTGKKQIAMKRIQERLQALTQAKAEPKAAVK